MTIAFTICSNNYLAHAKTVGDSFLTYHPEARFIIGLVDKPDEQFDYSFFSDFEILLVDTLQINEFEELVAKYDITELNTSVKARYFTYLFKQFNAEKVIYLDPDLLITCRMDEVLNLLDMTNIVLTPHMTTPIDDEYMLTDSHILPNGIFNLGFLALSQYERVKPFLDWWNARLMKYCFRRVPDGQFYDQFWVNYVPTFYDNYFILKHPGYNVANWNLHERVLTQDNNNNFFINGAVPLKFFHFSGYKHNEPGVIAFYSDRFDFDSGPDLKPLFDRYATLLQHNQVETISKLPVFYFPPIATTVENSNSRYRSLKFLKFGMRFINSMIRGRLLKNIYRQVRSEWQSYETK